MKIGDELERQTEAFIPVDEEGNKDDEDKEETQIPQGHILDELVNMLQQVNFSVTNRMIPRQFSTRMTKAKGKKKCGFNNIALMTSPAAQEQTPDESRDDVDTTSRVNLLSAERRDSLHVDSSSSWL